MDSGKIFVHRDIGCRDHGGTVTNKVVLGLVIFVACGLAFAQTQRFAMTGTIFSMDGTPAAGVRVSAIVAPDTPTAAIASTAASGTVTDAAGRYRLEGILPGRYL